MASRMPGIPPVTSATCPVMSAIVKPPWLLSGAELRRRARTGSGRDADDQGVTPAAAQPGHAGAAAAAAQLVGQVQHEAGPGCTDGVAHRYRGARSRSRSLGLATFPA